MKTLLRDIDLTPAKVVHDRLVRRTYWAILDQNGLWLPASLHVTRSGSIRRGMQICFPADSSKKLVALNDEKTNQRMWARCKRWGYRCQRVTVTPSPNIKADGL